MTPSSDRLDRRLKFVDNLGYALGRLHLLPDVTDVGKVPVAKRKAGKPARWMTFPLPAGFASEDRVVSGRGGPITVRVYTPETAAPGQPPVLYIHGGGWVTGGLESCHWLCAELTVRLSAVIVSVDYRLAPEDPYPAGLEDCQDALEFLHANAAELGVDGARIIVGGDSAGGNLAAALALWDAAQARRIVQQLLIYPALDLTVSSPSQREGLSRMMTPEQLEAGVAHYLGRTGDVKDPLVSPLFADSVEGVAPAVILTGQHDPLRDDGKLYADKLADAGVTVAYRNYGTVGHGFFSMPRLSRESAKAMVDLVALSRAQLS